MKFSIEDIREMMNNKIKEYNLKFNQDINMVDFEISMSGRMTRCAGKYTFKRSNRTPVSFKFSKPIFEAMDDEFKYDTILHELAHYIATEQYEVDCNHDSRWKNVCANIGMSNADVRYRLNEEDRKKFRYNVYCPVCGNVIYHYIKLTDKLKYNYSHHYVSCRKCRCKELEIIDNKLGKTIIK